MSAKPVQDKLIEVEINGEMYPARITTASLYDPAGERMRG